METMRIIYQVFKREEDLNVNFAILKTTIFNSKGLYGPFQEVAIETSKEEEDRFERHFDENQMLELQELCVKKIKEFEIEEILSNRNLLRILYKWEKWDKDGLNEFVVSVLADDNLIWQFLPRLVSKSKSSSGGYGYDVIKEFNFESLENFVPSEQIQIISDKVKSAKGNPELYDKHQELIDLFLAGPKEDNF